MLGKWFYLLEHAIWLLISMFWYRPILFKVIPGLTLEQSKMFLWGCLIFFSILGVVFAEWEEDDWVLVTSDLLLGYGTYSLILYYSYFKTRVHIIFAIAALFTLFCCVLIFGRKIQHRARRRRIIAKRLGRAAAVCRKSFALAMAVFMLPIGFKLLYSGTLMSSTVEKVEHYGDAYNMDNNMETFLLFQEEEWEKLSMQERLNALQVVANCEANYLGLPIDVSVESAYLDETIAGCYVNDTHQIMINVDYLMDFSAEHVLHTLCHEVYHAYQHQLCLLYQSVDESQRDLLVFERVDNYVEEFANYTNATENLSEYYRQYCEIYADSYADDSVREYYYRINRYLKEQANGE